MPRFARVVVPQCPHHITQRGNARRDIFFTDLDREVYLGLLHRYATLRGVDVLGYCLMTNHVHLVLLPNIETALAKLMRETAMRYAQFRNAIERSSGHLWQSRYYSCAVEPAHLAAVMRYVELNPVRAGIAAPADQYRWSSARAHVAAPWEATRDPAGLLSLSDWDQCWSPAEWASFLKSGSDQAVPIRQATYAGRPLGSAEFVKDLERYLDRRITPGRPGRPRRAETGRSLSSSAKI